MNVPILSPKTLLKANFVLGAFVVLTNGSALLLTVAGGRSHLGGQVGEIALWAVAGLILLCLSLFGVLRPRALIDVLEVQVAVTFGLISGLVLWGLAVVVGMYRTEGAFVWSAGLLSILGLYSYALYFNVTAIRGWGKRLKPFALAFVAACVLVDVAAFIKAVHL